MLNHDITSATQFHELFKQYGRGDQYSHYGFDLLFEHLQSLSDDLGEDISLDPVGICCEWCEYDTIDEAVDAYGLDSEEDLEANTIVLGEYGDGTSTSVMVLSY